MKFLKGRAFRILVLFLAFFHLLGFNGAAEEVDELYREQMEASGAEELLQVLPQETLDLLENLGIEGLDSEGIMALQPKNTMESLLALLADQSQGVFGACGVLLGVILLYAWMESLRQTLKEPAISEVFDVVCALVACTAVLLPLSACIQKVGEAAESVSIFMVSFVPVYSGILLTAGEMAMATSYNTVVLFASELITLLTTNLIVPMMMVSLAMGLTGSLSPGMRLDGVGGMINKGTGWLLGITTTLFVGLLSLQGVVGAATDTLAGRAIRFSLSSFVPVVGSSLSEAFTTVKGCLTLLKSTVGGFGILATALIVLPPILECVVWTVGLSLCGMVADMFGQGRIGAVLKFALSVVKTLIGVLAACSLFMIVATTIVSKASGG